MSYLLPEESNPFEAPKARIGDLVSQLDDTELGNAELVRYEHINHEASIKSLGILAYLAAAFSLLIMIVSIFVAAGIIPMDARNAQGLPPEMIRYFYAGIALFYSFVGILMLALGIGMRRLQVWTRWTVLVLSSISILYFLVVGLVLSMTNVVAGVIVVLVFSVIPGYLVYLMAIPKSGMVFSSEYKLIIQKTPHVKARTSLITKIFLVLLVAVVLFVIIAAIMAPRK